MGFLANTPKVSNHAAGMVVFLCGYVAAAITAYGFFGTSDTIPWLILCIILTSLLCMSLAFGVAWSLKRTDSIDIAWGLVFIVIAAASWLLSEYPITFDWNVQAIVFVLVGLWGLRLAITMLLRVLRRPEDARYVELRKKWRGSAALNAYLRVFVVQGLLAVIISTGVIVVLTSPLQKPGLYTFIGMTIWAIGFFFEVVGDLQLRQFMKNSKNSKRLLTTGLWRYTRHPNYFGEAAMWWGIFIIGLSMQVGWLGIISPVTITFLLLFISGVPMAEAVLSKRHGWKQYAAKTSKFLPLPPKEV